MSILSPHRLALSLFLLFFFPGAQTAGDLILLNCGAASNSTDISRRSWETDHHSSYVPQNAADLSSTSTASHIHPSIPDLVPYQTVRIFFSPFTYSFPLPTGHKIVRLYFNSDTYSGFNTSLSYFSVTANGFTLLTNFSAFLNSPNSNPSFIKEFILNVKGNRRIDLKFSPNPNSFAFINGIEIVSLPDELYFRNRPIKFVPNQLYYLRNDTALETLFRLNVGGADVQIQDDSGMFRYWSQDDNYIFGADYGYTPYDINHTIQYTRETPSYSAPKIVYRTSRTMANTSISLEWAFSVDSGFYYLLRFHFCEIQLEVTKQNERVFTINIDQKTAELEADVIFWTGGAGIPIFRDYIKWVPNNTGGRRGKKDLRVSLFPNNEALPMYSNALLNGLEIFKLSDSKRNLAAPNPEPEDTNSPPLTPEKKKIEKCAVIWAVIGSVICSVTVVAAASYFVFRWRRWEVKNSSSCKKLSRTTLQGSGSGVSLLSDLNSHSSDKEIKVPQETEVMISK